MNSEELKAEWNRICNYIKNYENIDISQVNAFFSRLVPQAMSEGFLMLTADNEFLKGWTEKHYVSLIKDALQDLYGLDFTVVIEVDESQQTRLVDNQTKEDSLYEQPSKQEGTQQNRIQTPQINSIEKETLAPATPPADAFSSKMTFENFVIGESNNVAYSMAVAVAENPGHMTGLNPLFIYGRPGLGKTHLMMSIQNYIRENHPELRCVYTDSSAFLNEYVEVAIAQDRDKTSFRNFRNHYLEADVLLIDDVQFFQDKKETLNIVFQIFNDLTARGKQVVLSADRAPKNIDIDDRYKSRFSMGGTFDIQPPEVETKLGIIKSFVDEYRTTNEVEDFRIPDEIEQYIAENSSSNIRELKGAVTIIIYQMSALGKTNLSVEEVKDLLKDQFSGGAMKKLSIADIQKAVESYYKVTHQDLVSSKRSRDIVYARKMAIYLSRQMLDLPYNYIGKNFGGKDHTTVMYSVTNVEEKLKENVEMREEIESIKKIINES